MSDDFDIKQIMDDGSSSEEYVTVTSPSGALVQLINDQEADHYNRISGLYQKDNKFSNISDLLELDRILMFEIASYRWNQWFGRGEDYDGRKINVADAQKALDLFSKEIRGIKKDLGIDKATRDRDQGESLADYIANLGIRAKEFGISRNRQAVRAITILMELRAIVDLYENSDDAERKIFKARLEDLPTWIKERGKEFDEIDAALKKNQQYWIQEINE